MSEKSWKAGTGQRINALYAWVALEDDGGEGVCAALLPGMPGMTPLIGADIARIDSYRPIAREIAKQTGKFVSLRKFTADGEQEIIEP